MRLIPSGNHLPQIPIRHRDLLLKISTEDSDLLVHEVLAPFAAAYLDQGYAHWRLPNRDDGFYQSFLTLFSKGGRLIRRLKLMVTRDFSACRSTTGARGRRISRRFAREL